MERTLGLLEPATDVAALADCDLVIEAVFEELDVKHDLFGRSRAVSARTRSSPRTRPRSR